MLLGSIGLTMAVLALSLIVQSRLLRGDSAKSVELGRTLKTLANKVCFPIGTVLVVIGFLFPIIMESSISVAVVLTVLAITMLIQSQILGTAEDNTISLSHNIRVYAFISAGIAIGSLIILIIQTIKIISCS